MAVKKKLSIGRHRRACSMCAHPQCAEIEAAFVSWRSPAVIAQEFGLADRATVYRHAHAFGLFEKRQRNVRSALGAIIEQAGRGRGDGICSCAGDQAYAKLNAAGQWIERTEQVNLNDLFDRMRSRSWISTPGKERCRSGLRPRWGRNRATVGGSDE